MDYIDYCVLLLCISFLFRLSCLSTTLFLKKDLEYQLFAKYKKNNCAFVVVRSSFLCFLMQAFCFFLSFLGVLFLTVLARSAVELLLLCLITVFLAFVFFWCCVVVVLLLNVLTVCVLINRASSYFLKYHFNSLFFVFPVVLKGCLSSKTLKTSL
jgi:hypothetical protein